MRVITVLMSLITGKESFCPSAIPLTGISKKSLLARHLDSLSGALENRFQSGSGNGERSTPFSETIRPWR